jgi:hypothetical protein
MSDDLKNEVIFELPDETGMPFVTVSYGLEELTLEESIKVIDAMAKQGFMLHIQVNCSDGCTLIFVPVLGPDGLMPKQQKERDDPLIFDSGIDWSKVKV